MTRSVAGSSMRPRRTSPTGDAGTRAAHSHGIGAVGWFEASDVAHGRCAAKHFSGERIPVSIRFSNGSGERREYDRTTDARGLAVKFFAGTPDETDLIAMSMPVFFVRNAPDFIEFSTKAGVPAATATPGLWERIRNELRLLPTPRPNPYNAPIAPRSDALMAWADEHPRVETARSSRSAVWSRPPATPAARTTACIRSSCATPPGWRPPFATRGGRCRVFVRRTEPPRACRKISCMPNSGTVCGVGRSSSRCSSSSPKTATAVDDPDVRPRSQSPCSDDRRPSRGHRARRRRWRL